MSYGYTNVSTANQKLDFKLDALKAAGSGMIMTETGCVRFLYVND